MDNKEFIEYQMRQHKNYANSFKKAPSNTNEHFHPKTRKMLSWSEVSSLIDRDAEKRANAIIKKMSEV